MGESYFLGRKAIVQGISEHMWVNVEGSCSQRSIAGPFVWSLLAGFGSVVEYVTYADNIFIFVGENIRRDLELRSAE